ncbi:hypothetical protein B0H10DRAFT_2071503 [Mycena sp. CBHHK59/15]|nr:hypothetical protein B0H10DRAFT_2071503 [Mycena sp. CBHHK59/15]
MLRACAQRYSVRPLSTPVILRGRSPLLPCRSYFKTQPLELPPKNRTKHRHNPAPVPQYTAPAPQYASPESAPIEPEVILLDQNGDKVVKPPVLVSVRNQALFVGFGIFGVFLWAAVQTNTDTDKWVERITQGQPVEGLDNDTIRRTKEFELVETLKGWLRVVVRETESLSPIPRASIRDALVSAANVYVNASDAQRICWAICAFNGAVFLAWKVPRFTPFMMNNFLHYPLSGKSRTLLTSVFSHSSFFHLLFNSMALSSGFGAATAHYLSRQQKEGSSGRLESTVAYHFLAFFVAAGLLSSLASHNLRVTVYNAMVRRLAKAVQPAMDFSIRPSLGASGAIYATVTLCALAFPETKVQPLFIPLAIPIQYGVGGMVALDLIGLIRGWSTFDHFAHLGGAMFGLWYYMYGTSTWDQWRDLAAYLFDDRPEEVRIVRG